MIQKGFVFVVKLSKPMSDVVCVLLPLVAPLRDDAAQQTDRLRTGNKRALFS
jgi:hypothetical protein